MWTYCKRMQIKSMTDFEGTSGIRWRKKVGERGGIMNVSRPCGRVFETARRTVQQSNSFMLPRNVATNEAKQKGTTSLQVCC